MGGLSDEGRTHEFLNTLEGGFEPGLTSCRVGRMPTKLRVHSLMYGRCGGSLCNFILEGPVPWRNGAAFAKDWPNWRLGVGEATRGGCERESSSRPEWSRLKPSAI